MTAHELLDMIGDTRGDYILNAQQYREEIAPPRPKTIPLRKIWLIAAVIAMTLLLVGCTVVYVLSLQEMKVGEHAYIEPAYINEEGEKVPAAGKTTTLVSLQGVYQPALQEWLAFRDSYDPDNTLAAANNRNESGVPEPYHTTYSCYTWEMVDKLDEIIKKYDLKLLEPYILVQDEEEEVLFSALGLENAHRETARAQVDYDSGYFYPEGTFSISADITLTDSEWSYVNMASMRYSLKEYFDPVSGSVGDIESYTQWNYTTADGTQVLLAMNEEHARIYANLEDAFVSIQMDAYGYEDRDTVPMPPEALEQIADVFDYHLQPEYADLELVQQMMAEIAAQKEAEAAAAKAEEAAVIAGGYENYLKYKLEQVNGTGAMLYYSLYDLNGDGAEELLIQDAFGYCYEVLSEREEETFRYFTQGKTTYIGMISPCEGNIFQLYNGIGDWDRYYYFQAGAESATYIVGLTHHKTEGTWYYHPDDDPWTENEEVISEAEAQAILDDYTVGTLGEAKAVTEYFRSSAPAFADPYGAYIAERLEGENTAELTYTLMDLNGDGVEELLIEGPFFINGERAGTALGMYSQAGAELLDMNILPVHYVCENNVLEYATSDDTGAEYHNYYIMTDVSVKIIDTIEYDPVEEIWTRDQDGPFNFNEQVIPEAEARSIIDSYKRLELDMRPLTEYPLN